jgi:hypothetical protein
MLEGAFGSSVMRSEGSDRFSFSLVRQSFEFMFIGCPSNKRQSANAIRSDSGADELKNLPQSRSNLVSNQIPTRVGHSGWPADK